MSPRYPANTKVQAPQPRETVVAELVFDAEPVAPRRWYRRWWWWAITGGGGGLGYLLYNLIF